MRFVRLFTSILLFFLLLFLAIFVAPPEMEIFGNTDNQEILARHKKIDSGFKIAAKQIDLHIGQHGTWPDDAVLQDLGSANNLTGLTMSRRYFSKNRHIQLGDVPENAYLLSSWNGSEFEYYASWLGKSNLHLTIEEIYTFGSLQNNRIGYLVILIGLVLIIYWIWPKRAR